MIDLLKVVFSGARDYSNGNRIRHKLTAYKKIAREQDCELLVIVGDAPGADQLANYTAQMMDIHTAVVQALWATRHKVAGPQRNAVILALEPTTAVFFHDDIAISRGTKDCIKQAESLGIIIDDDMVR